MPNIDTLIESISQLISSPASQDTTYFSTRPEVRVQSVELRSPYSKPL